MNSLMMHCGSQEIDGSLLHTIDTPEPTDTHFPIPHYDFFQMALDRLADHGYRAETARHFLNREDAHYFGLMQLRHLDEPDPEEGGRATMCALRNTHDKTFAASLAIGARVFVCDNLSFSGDIVVGRKHTANIRDELPERLDEAIGQIRVMRKRQDVRFAEYKQAPLNDRTADHLIMECYRTGIINLKRIGRVEQEWREPTADHGDKSVWRYFNAVTAALTPPSTNQLMQLPKKTIDLHLLLDRHCHVDFDEPEPPAEVSLGRRLMNGVNFLKRTEN